MLIWMDQPRSREHNEGGEGAALGLGANRLSVVFIAVIAQVVLCEALTPGAGPLEEEKSRTNCGF